MWMIETEAQREAREKAQREAVDRMADEGREKAKAREGWVKSGTCPHCGQCPPLPPWLVG